MQKQPARISLAIGLASLPPKTTARNLSRSHTRSSSLVINGFQIPFFFSQDSDGDKSDDNLVVDVSNEVTIPLKWLQLPCENDNSAIVTA